MQVYIGALHLTGIFATHTGCHCPEEAPVVQHVLIGTGATLAS